MDDNSLTNYLKAQKKLKQISETTLLELFSPLLKTEQETLIQNILSIEVKYFLKQKACFSQEPPIIPDIKSYKSLTPSGSEEKCQLGLKAASSGKCGAILIAGGQGSRLGHAGPKGTFPITPVFHKSLFQIFCERVKQASEKANYDLPLAIMTSPSNDSLTRRFFAQHQYFGLKESQISFFVQSQIPLLDFEGHLFLNEKKQIAQGPDGNGNLFKEFKKQGLLKEWTDRGIEYLNLVLVDNPLADPYDFELFGELITSQADLSMKTCPRLSPKEKVGIIVSQHKKPIVIEYHEIPNTAHFNEEPAANLGLFALTSAFANQCASLELPLHKVPRKALRFDFEVQKVIQPLKPNCWKFEAYLFDIFPYSTKSTVISYQREKIFCPLKNKEGDFSPNSVRKSLTAIGIQ
ncbi:MAG: putative uridylyltransferase [Chlamydiae bacterium]|nr:putative uridylyltransferase [Chlamydiota bacterium]